MRALILVTVTLFAFACSDTESKPGELDAGAQDTGNSLTDGGADASSDSGADASSDGGADASRDAATCPVIIDETCVGTETPKFIPTEDGCGEVRCVPLDTFACGDLMCDRAGEYCDVFVPGVPPPDGGNNTSYSCQEYPAECLGANATCECVVGDSPADCVITDDGAMTVSVFAP